MDKTKIQALADLFMKTGKAHHHAYIETDGADPEWALWYASYLEKPLSDLLGTSFTQSKIVYELVRLDETTDTRESPWPNVYATDLVKKYS